MTSADRAAPPPTQTAVLALLPALDPVVARHRQHLDRSAAWGVPAHVTVLYPFVPPDQVDPKLVARLASALASASAFNVLFTRTAWFGEDLLWLDPDLAQPFRDLTAAVVAAFPDHPPYGGAFAEPTPHLTVGGRKTGGLPALLEAERDVVDALPVTARVDRVQLLAGTNGPGSWSVVEELLLS